MPVAPSEDFLTRKWGPMPVWAWGGLGLGGAYAVSRYRASKSQSQNQQQQAGQGAGAAAEPVSGGPEYIIENNLPWQTPASSPVNVTVTGSPVVMPPHTGQQPPHNGGIPGTPGAGIPGGSAIGPGSGAPAPSAPAAPSAPSAPIAHKVVAGDNLTKIAQEYGYGNNWQAIWQYNTGPSSPHSAAAVATLLKQGPNLIYAGQTIYIPPK